MNAPAYSSVTELALSIRSKKISSRQAVQACLDRIEKINPVLNAVVQISKKAAIKKADLSDQALAAGQIFGPLHGVPMTLKDSFDSKDFISTGGTLGRKAFIPPEDATVLKRLKHAGAILIGKTNTPELTLSYNTDNLIYGQTSNPYDTRLSPGGSSGGAAAVVAAGGSSFDIGSDFGGSLRYPAHCCGIATIKPTSGRVPRTGHILPFGGMLDAFQQIGPFARYVKDLKLLLSVICGPDGIDPAIVPMPFGDPDNIEIKNLRVAFHTDNGIVSPLPEIQDIVSDAAEAMEKKGAVINKTRPGSIEQAFDIAMGLIASDGGASTRRLLEKAGTKTHGLPWLDTAQPAGAEDLDRLFLKWDQFKSTMLSFFQDYDIILSPVNAFCALHNDDIAGHLESFSYTMAYNLTGWPAAVVRAGSTSKGLPIGIQVIARPWREDMALAVAQFIEDEMEGYRHPDNLIC